MPNLGRIIRRSVKCITPPSLRPIAYLTRQIEKCCGGCVYSGPFRGMRYSPRPICSAGHPKLIGVYERELHSVIERACRLEVGTVVNVGCAEGYYAVGLALRMPSARVIAYDPDPAAQVAVCELATLNGVAERIEVRGLCRPGELELLGRSLIVCDCEGDERDLLKAGGLSNSFILVETHEFLDRGITAELQNRFKATHRIEVIDQEPRRRRDYPFSDWYGRLLPETDFAALLNEARPEPMQWLWMEPR